MKTLYDYLKAAIDKRASDLHLACNEPPLVRVDGTISPLDLPPLEAQNIRDMIYDILTEDQKKQLETEWQLCFSMTKKELGHFRVNLYFHIQRLEAAVRIGSVKPYSFEELGLPPIVEELALRPRGLLLITGPTGVGKTTTFNSIIDYVNSENRAKIVTVEDPIEYIHKNKNSYVVQQELNTDVKSYSKALVHILRQDPDVIGIGEMRDYDTISTALTAAETGHLVIATLHTNDASRTINRIIDVFPPESKSQVRNQLASTLVGIISQQLLPRFDGKGRVLAYEILISNEAVQTVIREDRMQNLPNIILTNTKSQQMQLMDISILELYKDGIISYDTAMSKITDVKSFKKRLKMSEPVE